jgi:hypothetical protein
MAAMAVSDRLVAAFVAVAEAAEATSSAPGACSVTEISG